MFLLFFMGIVEMAIITVWTKEVAETKVMASGAITFLNIMVWYYVLERIVSDLQNWKLVAFYSLGCSVGTMAVSYYYKSRELRQLEEGGE